MASTNETEAEEDIYENIETIHPFSEHEDQNDPYQDIDGYANPMSRRSVSEESHNPYQDISGYANWTLMTGSIDEGPREPDCHTHKGISDYPPDFELTLDQYFKNSEPITVEYSNNSSEERHQQLEHFFLHSVLPYIERRLNRSDLTPEILKVLPTLCCCRNGSLVNRYALHLVLSLMKRANYETERTLLKMIVQTEKILKVSILGEQLGEKSIFDLENEGDQGLRIVVYSRVLTMLHAGIVQGHIPDVSLLEYDKDNLLEDNLTDLRKQKRLFSRHDKPRYAIACVLETKKRLLKKTNKQLFAGFLKWLHEQNQNCDQDKASKSQYIKSFFSSIKAEKNGWFDFHTAILCLGVQIHEQPMLIDILGALLDEYCKAKKPWSEEAQWQTGLVLSFVLEDCVMSSKSKDTRTDACLSLLKYFGKGKKTQKEKAWVKESCEHCLFAPVNNVQQLVLKQMQNEPNEQSRRSGKHGVKEKDVQEAVSVSESMKYLTKLYQKQMPTAFKFLFKSSSMKGYFSSTFRGEKCIVKVLKVSQDEISHKNERKDYKNLVHEVHVLRRLNAKPHPNIPRVFAYDTFTRPYHMISEFLLNSPLLELLWRSRSDTEHILSPSTLVQMTIGIVNALIYLDEQHLVHLAVMASNVLVDTDNTCKLAGFHWVREMKITNQGKEYEYVSLHEDTSIRHAAPESLTDGRFSEKTVVWACGILMYVMHTHGDTPFNKFKNDETDEIRAYILKQGKLPVEECIPNDILEMIQQCMLKSDKRLTLKTLKANLEKVYKKFIISDADRSFAALPGLPNESLEKTISARFTLENCEDNTIIGSPTRSHDIPIISRNYRGSPVICELVERTNEADLDRLMGLKNDHIVKILTMRVHDERGRFVALVTECFERGNLLQYVLSKQCQSPDELVPYLAQIASAMKYMHDSNMLHRDLRAENIQVVSHNEVKIARLGRAKAFGETIHASNKENVQTMIFKDMAMAGDAARWSSPEVNKNRLYSAGSDVYSFGILGFELYWAFEAKEGSKPEDVKPFSHLEDNQILAYLEGNNRPDEPKSMQTWLYKAIKQCLLHKSQERPPFVLLDDCLTYSKPFDSCLLWHWKKRHPGQLPQININVKQPETAAHVTDAAQHLPFDVLEQLAPVEVFLKHTYKYVPGYQDPDPANSDDDDENDFDLDGYKYAYIPTKKTGDENSDENSDESIYMNLLPELRSTLPLVKPHDVVDDENDSVVEYEELPTENLYDVVDDEYDSDGYDDCQTKKQERIQEIQKEGAEREKHELDEPLKTPIQESPGKDCKGAKEELFYDSVTVSGLKLPPAAIHDADALRESVPTETSWDSLPYSTTNQDAPESPLHLPQDVASSSSRPGQEVLPDQFNTKARRQRPTPLPRTKPPTEYRGLPLCKPKEKCSRCGIDVFLASLPRHLQECSTPNLASKIDKAHISSPLEQLRNIFPKVNEEILKTLLEDNNHSVENAVGILLENDGVQVLQQPSTISKDENEDDSDLTPAFGVDLGCNDALSPETALKLFQTQNISDGLRQKFIVCRVDGISQLRREIMGIFKTSANLKAVPKVTFEGEEGVGSGPVREFLRECIRVLDEGIPSSSSGKPTLYFEGENDHRVPIHDHSMRLTGAFRDVGRILGHSVLHGGPGLYGLSPAVKFFLSNDMEGKIPPLSLHDIPDVELQELISEVDAMPKDQQITQEQRASLEHYLIEAGLDPDQLRDNRKFILDGLMIFFVIDKRRLELQDIVKGMEEVNLHTFLKSCPSLGQIAFPLEAEKVVSGAEIKASLTFEEGVNEEQNKTFEFLKTYIDEIEGQDEGERLQTLVLFWTGSNKYEEKDGKLLVKFDSGENTLPLSETCIKSLILPIKHKEYSQFKRNMDIALTYGAKGFAFH